MKLIAENLSYRFKQRIIFTHLNFTLNLDNHYLLTGPVGSGKTTLAEILSGFRFPEKGTVKIEGTKIKYPPGPDFLIGMIKQNLNEQRLFNDSRQEIIFSLENRGINQKRKTEILTKLMKNWNIDNDITDNHMMFRNLNTITASLLAAGKEFIIFDELLILLSPSQQKQFLYSVFNHHRGSLFITQYPDLFKNYPVEHLHLTAQALKSGKAQHDFNINFNDLDNFYWVENRKKLSEIKVKLIRSGHKIQYLPYFAEDYFFFNDLTAELAWSGIPEKIFMKKALSAGIPPDFRFRNPLTLSGGERRKLIYLIALEIDSEYLIIEHPLLYLDGQARHWLKQVFYDYIDKGGKIYCYLPDPFLLSV